MLAVTAVTGETELRSFGSECLGSGSCWVAPERDALTERSLILQGHDSITAILLSTLAQAWHFRQFVEAPPRSLVQPLLGQSLAVQ